METVLIMIAAGAMCCVSFVIGTRARSDKGIRLPEINPLKAVQDRRARKAAQGAENRIAVIMRNIENYNGTPMGQEDVPGR